MEGMNVVDVTVVCNYDKDDPILEEYSSIALLLSNIEGRDAEIQLKRLEDLLKVGKKFRLRIDDSRQE